MGFLSYSEFLNEDEKVSLDKDLKEYTLTHTGADRFQLKSGDFYKEFSVLPYKTELIDDFKDVHKMLSSAIETSNVQSLYKAVIKAESIPYPYGNVFTSKFSLVEIPELAAALDDDQKRALQSSESEFLHSNFSQLGKDIKDSTIKLLIEKAEVLCAVIEALFYYIRTIDKENFYDGKNLSEIIDEYEEQIEKSSKEESFSYDGPFSDANGESDLTDESRTGYWKCEKNLKKFLIQATVQPKELYNEENIGGTKGLKFSLSVLSDTNPDKEYSFFPIVDLSSRIKLFYDNILKK